MIPKVTAVRSWVNSIVAIRRTQESERAVNESRDPWGKTMRERGEILRVCGDCRSYQPCEAHMEEFAG